MLVKNWVNKDYPCVNSTDDVKTVAEALNDFDTKYRNLIFSEGKFRACQEVVNNSKVNYNGTSEEALNNDLVTESSPEFTVIGNKMCLNKEWVYYNNFPRNRFLVSKMYNLSFDGDNPKNFDLICESANKATDLSQSEFNDLGLGELSSSMDTFCILSSEDVPNEKKNVLIGLSYDYDDEVEDILSNIGHHLELLGLLDTDKVEEFSNLCSGELSDEFFAYCGEINNVAVRYNSDFNLLFIAYLDQPLKDFNGFFYESANLGDYISHIWTKFLSLFKGWFGGGIKGGSNVNWTSETLFPLHEGDWKEYGVNMANFDKLVIEHENEKRILGIVEYRVRDLSGNKDEYVAVMFTGFNTSVERLGKQYFNDHKYALNYLVGNDTQILHYVNPLPYGINTEGEPKEFEPSFDWRRLGAALRFNASEYYEDIYNQTQGNCIVEFGEQCDSCDDGAPDVFKYNNNTCAFWMGKDYSSNVTCYTNNNTLNDSGCESSSGGSGT